MLINNAGLGGLGRFDRIDPARIGDMLQVNIVALTELTRMLLPGMIARGHGRIMLVGSVAGVSARARHGGLFRQQGLCAEPWRGARARAARHRRHGHDAVPGATATEFFEVAGASPSVLARRPGRMMPAERVARLGYALSLAAAAS